jgi:hypothetical protein
MADGLLPKIQRRVSDFAGDERGHIPKRSLVTIGGILSAGAALAALASNVAAYHQLAGCSGHSNSIPHGHGDNVTPAVSDPTFVTHSDSPPYTTHCNHGNHSSY